MDCEDPLGQYLDMSLSLSLAPSLFFSFGLWIDSLGGLELIIHQVLVRV